MKSISCGAVLEQTILALFSGKNKQGVADRMLTGGIGGIVHANYDAGYEDLSIFGKKGKDGMKRS
jgi:hypothetical protein